MTVKAVDYTDFAANFGEGVNLKEITIEMTNERPARRIEKKLPWLSLRAAWTI